MIPPRRRSTRWRVDSERGEKRHGTAGGAAGNPPPKTPGGHPQNSRGTFLDVVVCEGAAILQLFAREDQSLLVGGDP